MRRVLAVGAITTAFGSLALLPAACQSATQITIDVTTDIDCSQARGTQITVGRLGSGGGVEDKPPTSTTARCEGGHIGTLVVVPSGAKDDEVAVKVVTGNGRAVEECVYPAYGKGCIVARRALHYIPRASLTVPVVMRGVCDGIACDDPTKTCVRGQCVDATIGSSDSCRGAGCPENTLSPGDGGAPDGSSPDASPDAAPDAPAPDGGVVTGCDMRGLQPDAPWPMQGYCPSRRSRSPLRGPATRPRVVWDMPHAANQLTPLLVAADGTVLVTTMAPALNGLDGLTGNAKWAMPFALPNVLVTAPAIAADGTVYVTSLDALYAINVVTGLAKWAGPYTFTDTGRGGLTLDAKGNILFSNSTAAMIALTPTAFTAGPDWSYTASGNIDTSPPAIDTTGFIYFAAPGALVVLQGDGGHVRDIPIPGIRTDAVGIAQDGTLRMQSDDNMQLHARKPTGEVMFDAPSAIEAYNLAIGDDGTTYLPLNDNSLRAIADDGGARWSRPDGTFSTPTVGADGTVYVAQNRGGTVTVFALDPGDGHTIWQSPLPGSPGEVAFGPVIGRAGLLYLSAANGHVYALGP